VTRLLGGKIDTWIADTVGGALSNYRHEIAGVIAETVERWDATETADKIELQVGKDLQFIRINGTICRARSPAWPSSRSRTAAVHAGRLARYPDGWFAIRVI
jgi:hypothetical protein